MAGKPATPEAAATGATVAALALLLGVLFPPASAATFKCSGVPNATCKSLLGFPVVNATNYTSIASLFRVPVGELLSANKLKTNPSSPLANTTVRVPIPCTCSGGVGTSGNATQYTVKKGEFLDMIARTIFGGLVVFEEVAKASGVKNPELVESGQVLTIPLPCSCDQVVPGEAVVHYAYKVAEGDSVDGIAATTGTTVPTILSVNNIKDPKGLMSETILDVPLRACGPSPSPLLAGTNLTVSDPCPSKPTSSGPSVSPGWTPLLLLSNVLILAHYFPRLS